MGKQLRPEEIYDALLDDEAFEQLPSRMAEAFGARSCVLHWRNTDNSPEIMAHSGYWNEGQLKTYAENFTPHDLWALEAMQPHRVNRVWNYDDLVRPAVLERGPFYNDWIRPMGDDTFHCLGMAMNVPAGVGLIGMHKGRTQGTFSEENLRGLEESVSHLRRVFMLRGRLSAVTRQARVAEAALDGMTYAVITLSQAGRILHMNAAAESITARNDGLGVRNGRLAVASAALRDAIAHAAAPSCPASTALSLERSGDARYDITVAPLRIPNEPGCVFVLVRDRSPAEVESRVRTLSRALFGLTPAEAAVAGHLAAGRSPQVAAELSGVAIGTVRTHIRRIFEKVGVNSQVELLARLAERL